MTQEFKKGFLWAKPEDIAKRVIHAMAKNKNIVYTPGFWRFIMLIVKAIPESVMKKLAM